MICDSLSFEPDYIDKHTDYTFLSETPYCYPQYFSPTPSTPLSSPASSLILDDMTVHQHQQSLSVSSISTAGNSSIVPAVSQQQPFQNVLGGNDDWLLDPFYDVGSFRYQPLAISPAESDQLINAAAQSLNCPQFQQSMMMAESTEIPIGGLVSPPHPSHTTEENSGAAGNFALLDQQFQYSDYHQHPQQVQQQHYQYHDQQNIDSSILENPLPLFTASSQVKPARKSSNTTASPITARDLNIEYPTALSTSTSSSSLHVPNDAQQPNTQAATLVTPTSSTSLSSTTSASSTVRPAPRKKKARQSASSFQCDFPGCQKTFTRPYNLNSHRRTHTNEKPYDCPHCPKTFARQHDRNRHAKLHSGVKPFLCHFCSKAFARQDALTRHYLWSEDHKVIGCSILNRKNGKESSTPK